MRHIITLMLPIAAILCGCAVDEPAPESRAVIEGWIDSDGYPRVIFTASFVAGEENVTVTDKLIHWGKVTISDGEHTVTMTGGPDSNLFPPYSYYTYDMQGKPGKTYTVTADFNEFHATATATMPEPPVIAEVRVAPIEYCDTLRAVTIVIQAPEQGCPAYYHISTRVLPDEGRYLPAVMGCVKAENPGEKVEIAVLRGKTSTSKDDFVAQLPSNRHVNIKVERVNREIYEFWNSFNEATLFGGSMFVSNNTSLTGNIEGGYGYWSPQGVEIVRLPPER